MNLANVAFPPDKNNDDVDDDEVFGQQNDVLN